MSKMVFAVVFVALNASAQTLSVDGSNSPFVIATDSTYSQVTVASGGTLVVNARLTVTGDLLVQPSGRVTLDAGLYVMNLTVGGTVTVDFGGVVEADGKGLKGAPAAGFGDSGATLDVISMMLVPGSPNGAGGSHASRGANGLNGYAPNPVYGDARTSYPGSGGGAAGAGVGGAGGGVVNLTAGSLVLNGQLRANGGNGFINTGAAGGGSGGSISVRVGQFSGTGSIAAMGGVVAGGGATGGGGRIKVLYTSFGFVGAFGGASSSSIHLYDSGLRQLRIVNDVTLSAGETYDSIAFAPGGALTITGRVTITTPLVVPAGNTVTLSSPNALDAMTISDVNGTVKINADVSQSTDMKIAGLLVLDGKLSAPNLEVVAGGAITQPQQSLRTHLSSVGTVTVATGGTIRGTGTGYGAGITIDPVNDAIAPGSGMLNGGSHGGLGGRGRSSEPLASVYDIPAAPRYPGGGGGDGLCSYYSAGGNGGGLFRITAGTLRVDGNIVIDGQPGGNQSCGTSGGGGAGGSLVLTLGALEGTGSLYARGGNATNSGGGGGGLILISADTLASTVSLSVAGGDSQVPGAPGIITKTQLTSTPRILSTPPKQAKVGESVMYQARALGASPLTWSLVTSPPGATLNPATGLLTWLPVSAGPQSFSLKVANSTGSDTQVFTLEAFSPPSITSTANTSTFIGQAFGYDGDGRAEASGSGPIAWSAFLAPPGFTIDSATGAVSWLPVSSGSYSACIRATNGVGEAQQCWVVSVVAPPVLDSGVEISGRDAGVDARAPRFTSNAASTAYCGIPYRYSGSHVPEVAGSSPFVFSAAPLQGGTLPGTLQVDPATGEFSWTPSAAEKGEHPIRLTVTNAQGEDSQLFSIVVDCPEAKKLPIGCGCSTVDSAAWGALVYLVTRRKKQLPSTPRQPS